MHYLPSSISIFFDSSQMSFRLDSTANVDSNSKQWVLLTFPNLYSMDYYWSGTVVHRRNKYTEMHLLAIQFYMTCSYS